MQLILKTGCSCKPPDLKPYRVLISLLEKPEIGPTILDDILVDVFRALYLSGSRSSKDWTKSQHDELVKTSNLLFGTLEESYVWSFTGRLLQKSTNDVGKTAVSNKEVQPVGTGPPHFLEMCSLTVFLLDTLSVDSSSDTQVNAIHFLNDKTENNFPILRVKRWSIFRRYWFKRPISSTLPADPSAGHRLGPGSTSVSVY